MVTRAGRKALGLGANGAIFAMVDALLLRALPYPQADRLAQLTAVYRGPDGEYESLAVDGATWQALGARPGGGAGGEGAAEAAGAAAPELAVFSGWAAGVNLYAGAQAAYVDQQRVGAGFFEVLGVRPARGRGFLPEEDVPGGPAVVILSHGLWRRAFGADPDIVGQRTLLRGEP